LKEIIAHSLSDHTFRKRHLYLELQFIHKNKVNSTDILALSILFDKDRDKSARKNSFFPTLIEALNKPVQIDFQHFQRSNN